MGLNVSVVRAVFWRNFTSYFANPVGYLFIFAFTLAGAYFAFNDQFFAANMADSKSGLPPSCSIFANSMMRIAFFAARPMSMIRPI